ncbi:MAG: arginine N-succinyltransferase [Betaproteobacteria bacterium]
MNPRPPLLLTEQTPPDADETLLQVRTGDTAADGPPLAEARLSTTIGLEVPRFWFHVGCTVHASDSLGLFQRHRTLLLGNDHSGASELVLRPGADGATGGAALQLALQGALLLRAQRRARYAARMVAELPGLRDARGRSPFWDGLVRPFYGGEPEATAQRHGSDWRAGVAALLPRQAVYTAFLGAEVQAAIARVPAAALPMRELLEHAGLHHAHHVAIDDGGPVLEAATDALPTVAGSRIWTLAEPADESAQGPAHWVLAAPEGEAARAARAPARYAAQHLVLTPAAALQLRVSAGDRVRAWPVQGPHDPA